MVVIIYNVFNTRSIKLKNETRPRPKFENQQSKYIILENGYFENLYTETQIKRVY